MKLLNVNIYQSSDCFNVYVMCFSPAKWSNLSAIGLWAWQVFIWSPGECICLVKEQAKQGLRRVASVSRHDVSRFGLLTL